MSSLRPSASASRLEQQVEAALGLALVERLERVGQLGPRARAGCATARPSAANERGTASRISSASSSSPRRCSIRAERDRRVGAPGLQLQRAAQRRLVAGLDELVRLGGDEPVEEPLDRRRRLDADELIHDLAVLERLDRRDALDLEGRRELLVGVGVELRQHDLAVARGCGLLQGRRQCAARATPLGPEVDDHGHRARALDDLLFEGRLGDVDHGHAPFDDTNCSMAELDVHDSGEGTPVVLLHGLTATHRYVVMGSRALERSGHRVIAYDARGHGRSDPAEPYDYPALADDLERVLDERGIDRAVLAGASMGAHTLLRFALDHPERALALVVITPAYDPASFPATSCAGTRSPKACEHGGVEGFVEAYGAVTGPWAETTEKVLRQRLSPHEHPEAVAQALRQVPRSRPFERLGARRARDAGNDRRQPRRGRPGPSAAAWGRPTRARSRARGSSPRTRAAHRSPGKAASCRA